MSLSYNFLMRLIRKIGLIIVSSLLLAACNSSSDEILSDNQLVGTYRLNSDAPISSTFKHQLQAESLLEIKQDHTFTVSNFIDLDQNPPQSYKELTGGWKLELSDDSWSSQVILMNFDDQIGRGEYVVNTEKGISIDHLVGDPDSLEGIVYEKLK